MLAGKVAVITGAGRGIGRELALLFAKSGAKVVVNDMGGDTKGEGKDQAVADQVVEEIRKRGGEAVSNFDSVASMAGGESIVNTAVKAFGKIDILVNNAGILRDRIFFNMSEAEWDAVIAVHLKGAFATSRAAAPLMRAQKSGRIINFSSASGVIGNYGQANYAAAKTGIVGLTKSIALDLSRYNVTANCIVPFAWTRMIGTIPEDPAQQKRLEMLKKLSPAYIAPLLVFLASDAAQEVTGQIFGVRGKEIILFSQIRPLRTMMSLDGWTPEKIAESFLPAVRKQFYPLDVSADVFAHDPIV